MPDEFNVLIEKFTVNTSADNTKLITEILERLSSAGYNNVTIEISGDAKKRAENQDMNLALFDKILKQQSVPAPVVFDFMSVKSEWGNKKFIERIDFEW